MTVGRWSFAHSYLIRISYIDMENMHETLRHSQAFVRIWTATTIRLRRLPCGDTIIETKLMFVSHQIITYLHFKHRLIALAHARKPIRTLCPTYIRRYTDTHTRPFIQAEQTFFSAFYLINRSFFLIYRDSFLLFSIGLCVRDHFICDHQTQHEQTYSFLVDSA